MSRCSKFIAAAAGPGPSFVIIISIIMVITGLLVPAHGSTIVVADVTTAGRQIVTTTTPEHGKKQTTPAAASTHLPRDATTADSHHPQPPQPTDRGHEATPDPHDSATPHDTNGHTAGGHDNKHDAHKCPPEGEEGVRYVVAKFDFGHVQFPMIVALWIIFVTYAKIGSVQ